MTRLTQTSARPALASLSLRWLVLVVIALGVLVSSIGLTNSHGIAAIAGLHQLSQPSPEGSHGHEHADEGDQFTAVAEGSSSQHPHHDLDHSHDTGHHPPRIWGGVPSQLPHWEPMVRPRIDQGQAVRLDRPPMV